MQSIRKLPVFVCDMCGSCCKMSPVSVLPHEVVILEKLAENLGVEIRFMHGYVVYEAINEVNLAFSYAMQLISDKCPFLEENKCSIHYIYKPYICRSFPYIPRHVKYNIDEVNKYIVASVDYGLSLACHIVKRDREILERHAHLSNMLMHYLKGERSAAVEAENARTILLLALSKLWREGLVDIKTSKPGTPTMNLYEFLRRFYPDLPSVLGVDKAASRMKKWFKTY